MYELHAKTTNSPGELMKNPGDERRPQCRHCEIGHRNCIFDNMLELVRSTKPGTSRTSTESVWDNSTAQSTSSGFSGNIQIFDIDSYRYSQIRLPSCPGRG